MAKALCRLFAFILLAAGPVLAQRVEVSDFLDRGVGLEAPASRVVSLMPSHTEMLLALGAGGLMVGIDQDSPQPEGSDLPRLGSGFEPNLELLVSLEPDLVLTDAYSGVHDQLEQLGIEVFAGTPETVAQVLDFNTTLGVLVGREAEAAELVARQRAKLDSLGRQSGEMVAPAVYVELDPTPFVAGPGSYIDDLLHAVGAVNIVPDGLGPWPRLSGEFVLGNQPDFVLLLDAPFGETEASFRDRTGLANQDVVVVEVPLPEADLLSRPGPGLEQALDWLFSLLHPGAAAE